MEVELEEEGCKEVIFQSLSHQNNSLQTVTQEAFMRPFGFIRNILDGIG